MKWLILSSKLKQADSRIKPTPAIRRRKKNAPSPSNNRKSERKVSIVGLFVIISALLLGGIWWYNHNSPRFEISNIQVVNNHSYSEDEIIEMTDLEAGGNIFSFRPNLARDRLLRNTDFKDAYVRRIFPDTIRVDVVEREPRALVQFGTMYTIDEHGMILGPRKKGNSGKLPIIRGLRVKGSSIFPVDKREACLSLLRELEEKDIGSIVKIDEIRIFSSDLIEMRTSGDLEITLEQGKYDVQMGRLKTVLVKLGPDLSRAREVDLRYARVPVVFAD